MWMPERVWEQSFARDLVDAGIEYTVLDDFHFKNAGLERVATDRPLPHRGRRPRCCRCFPAASGCATLIPFADPQETIDYLAQIAERHPNAVVVFGDDGEKFGTWPETNKHVYDDGWLERFFDALVDNQRLDQGDHAGRGGRQRAAGRQDLPARQQLPRDDRMGPAGRAAGRVRADRGTRCTDDPRWPSLRPFVRGGFWRNFKVKYPEADEMYSRMMMVSRRLQETLDAAAAGDRSTASWSSRPGPNSIAASATAATGTAPSAASTCRTCATPSTST